MEQDGFIKELKELNRYLGERLRARGDHEQRRRLAALHGEFMKLSRLQGDGLERFFTGASLVGVDGSLNNFGASYPYVVTLFQALAWVTRTGGGEPRRIWTHQVFSPLLPRYREKVQNRLQDGMNPEDALTRLRWETLALLEAEVGRQALIEERPRLLLWDGGFARLESHAPALWEEMRDKALQQKTVMLGVTEEVATSILAAALTPGQEGLGDREILYGMLQEGEAYFFAGQTGGDKRRVYLRLAAHPQALAVDYLPEQEEELPGALNILYTITPKHGRGFPLWLDLVDREVRITREQVEVLLAEFLEPSFAELFLRPMRARREL